MHDTLLHVGEHFGDFEVEPLWFFIHHPVIHGNYSQTSCILFYKCEGAEQTKTNLTLSSISTGRMHDDYAGRKFKK